jgi:hypothetical protein
VPSLADFKVLVDEVESFDPVTRAFRVAGTDGPHSILHYYRAFDIAGFARRLDGILDLLNVTTDALAATWDKHLATQAARAAFSRLDDFEPTIQ